MLDRHGRQEAELQLRDMTADAVKTHPPDRHTDAADCGTLPNTAHASASNEPEQRPHQQQAARRSPSSAARSPSSRTPSRTVAKTSRSRRPGPACRTSRLDDDSQRALPNTQDVRRRPGRLLRHGGGRRRLEADGPRLQRRQRAVERGHAASRRSTSRATEHVTCTYTNTKLGSITVKKLTSPAGAPGSFTFSGDVHGLDRPQRHADDQQPPARHVHLDRGPTRRRRSTSGRSPAHDNNSDGVVGTGIATFRLEAGENITCTFTNVQRGSITIVKDAQPDSAAGLRVHDHRLRPVVVQPG